MAIFNGFQLMFLFAAAPFGITYLRNADFYAHMVLFWVLIAGYVIGFGALTVLVAENLDKK